MKTLKYQPAELLFQTLKQIRQAIQMNEIFEALVQFAKAIDFDRVIITSISPNTHEEFIDEIFFVYGNWTDRTNIEDRERYLRNCPITRHIFDYDEPFFWTKTTDKNNSKETYRVIKNINERGEVSGVQVPIFGRTGLEGAISFAGELSVLEADFRFILQSVCVAAFRELQKKRSLNLLRENYALSPREKEVLKWTALGRKQSEIAEILKISERTVENHLRSVRKKLEVKSTAQAIACALKINEIEL
ncbi:LuxR family transcriptional regulator [Acinetobacter lactucae]|uniref:LuxR family transcriptional regulator n=1 Tax=Acinetobacter lactucae TaxID=1785128 RepID=A0A429K4H4_9GAMM|nr:PA1136 family autoinducer-binding transcriptional regulator [Acinetobacter lactucae]RSO58817.1 LuxR family transcriptional regulator [Acinetobacter lactucae]